MLECDYLLSCPLLDERLPNSDTSQLLGKRCFFQRLTGSLKWRAATKFSYIPWQLAAVPRSRSLKSSDKVCWRLPLGCRIPVVRH